VTLPLAHHVVEALPVFVPAIIVCIAVAGHFLYARRHWDDDDEEPGDGSGPRS
jgi:hypothetical protein